MQLNEIHTEHEHATTSLKVVLLVFAIVLVVALAYLVWAQNTAPDTTDNSAATVKQGTTTEIDGVIDDKTDLLTYTHTKPDFTIKTPKSYSVKSITTSGAAKIIEVTNNGETSSAVSIEYIPYGQVGNIEEGGVKTVTDFNSVIKRYKEVGYGQEFLGETTLNTRRAFTMSLTDSPNTVAGYVVEGKSGWFQLTGEKDIILTFAVL